ncbi:MAG: CDP-alcohol phosphatidyltransferase family protein [Candidatus Schekmanbacteria bacterium]|nr:MAG: CDP-alcohol phosphatidyltransferase family protein [Candidatus Schekmanbacteria bacterium]
MYFTAKYIRENCQKKKEDEQFYAWLIMRRISPYVSSLLLRTSISANTVTLVGMILGVIGGILYVYPSMITAIAGSLSIQIWYLSDCVDGEIARCRNEFSDEGIFLDAISHHIVSFCAMGGFSAGLYLEHKKLPLLVAGVLFATFYHFNKMIFTSAQQTIYGKFKGKRVNFHFPKNENSFFEQNKKQKESSLLNYFLWAFRLWPSTGATINEIGILVGMMIAVFADYFGIKKIFGVSFYPDMRSILVFFYAFMLTLSFFGRFIIVLKNSFVSNWIGREDRKDCRVKKENNL